MMRIIKNVGLLSLLILLFSCQKETVVNPYLEVTSNNLKGVWTLKSVDGVEIDSNTYFHIRFDMDGDKYFIRENLTSIPTSYRADEGTFALYVDPEKGKYLRGINSIGEEWSDMYYVQKLTKTEMTWVGYNNPSFVQVFVKDNSIKVE